jgi:hypothetical protein
MIFDAFQQGIDIHGLAFSGAFMISICMAFTRCPLWLWDFAGYQVGLYYCFRDTMIYRF